MPVLIACTSLPEREASYGDSTVVSVSGAAPGGRAASSVADKSALAEVYAERAVKTRGRQAWELRLAAAEVWLDAQRPSAAEYQLDQIPVSKLNRRQQQDYLFYRSGIAEHQGRLARAIDLLPDYRLVKDIELQAKVAYQKFNLLTKARRYDEALEYAAVAVPNLGRSRLPTNVAAIWRNLGSALWRRLHRLGPAELTQIRRDASGAMAGWLDLLALGHISQAAGGAANEHAMRLDQWRNRYPGHAAEYFHHVESAGGRSAGNYSSSARQSGGRYGQSKQFGIGGFANRSNGLLTDSTPKRIAVLLPLSGPQGSLGQAVQKGFSTAHQAQVSDTKVDYYDTATGESILGIYHRALYRRADVIVGPLRKVIATDLALSADAGVPVLLLNRIPDDAQAAVYRRREIFQFAMTPEDDARNLARLMQEQQRQRILVMVPDSDYGRRYARALGSFWWGYGGQLVDTHYYQANSTDMRQEVSLALRANTDQPLWEDARSFDPDAPVGSKIVRETPLHQSIDAAVLVANPRDARLIAPLLKFHKAVDLPAYASASVWDGQSKAAEKRDLEGLWVCTLPALLDQQAVSEGHGEPVSQVRETPNWPSKLVAFGSDAYLLAMNLNASVNSVGSRLAGLTGDLFIGTDGLVRRNAACGQILNGQVLVHPPDWTQ